METLPREMHDRLCFLSGPSFAREIAERRPTAVSLAARNETYAIAAQTLLSSPLFRCYTTSDVIGVELGGALKNVIAIAIGIARRHGVGAELARGADHPRPRRDHPARRGARREPRHLPRPRRASATWCSPARATCRATAASASRSGAARASSEVLAGLTQVAEGVRTAKSAHELAQKLGVDMPITTGVYLMLFEGKNPVEAGDRAALAPAEERVRVAAHDASPSGLSRPARRLRARRLRAEDRARAHLRQAGARASSCVIESWTAQAVPRGYAQPATIADVRIAHILASLSYEDSDEKRQPLIRSQFVYELADGIALALAKAGPDDEVAAACVSRGPPARHLHRRARDRVPPRAGRRRDADRVLRRRGRLERDGSKVGAREYEIPTELPTLEPRFKIVPARRRRGSGSAASRSPGATRTTASP